VGFLNVAYVVCRAATAPWEVICSYITMTGLHISQAPDRRCDCIFFCGDAWYLWIENMNLLHATLLAPRILRWLLHFLEKFWNHELGFLVALSLKLTCLCDVMPCNLVDRRLLSSVPCINGLNITSQKSVSQRFSCGCSENLSPPSPFCTGLLKMIVGVLTTCHTQYTWGSSICIFFI